MPANPRLDDDGGDGDALARRMEESAAKIEKLTGDLQKGGLERALVKTLERNQRALEKQLGNMLRDTLTSTLGLKTGGGGAGIASLIGGFLPGFARGGVLHGRTTIASAGEAGPEVVLPLQRGRDGRLGVAATASQNANANANAPRRVEVVIHHGTGNGGDVAFGGDDAMREAVAGAVADALDDMIDERIALHMRAGAIGNRGNGGGWQI